MKISSIKTNGSLCHASSFAISALWPSLAAAATDSAMSVQTNDVAATTTAKAASAKFITNALRKTWASQTPQASAQPKAVASAEVSRSLALGGSDRSNFAKSAASAS